MAETLSQDSQNAGLVLRTEGLVKTYGKRTVVNHVSFDVKQGEIVGLLGPNGAGKTTSFYMTTGLVVPNEGSARNGIGYLAQEASVFRKMTVEDNIASVLEMTGKPKEYQKEKLESLISEFSLQKVRKNLGDRLSGGERRRTEIARSPYCRGGYTVYRVETEKAQYRRVDYRPQRGGDALYYRPCLFALRGTDPFSGFSSGIVRE